MREKQYKRREPDLEAYGCGMDNTRRELEEILKYQGKQPALVAAWKITFTNQYEDDVYKRGCSMGAMYFHRNLKKLDIDGYWKLRRVLDGIDTA